MLINKYLFCYVIIGFIVVGTLGYIISNGELSTEDIMLCNNVLLFIIPPVVLAFFVFWVRILGDAYEKSRIQFYFIVFIPWLALFYFLMEFWKQINNQ